MSGQVTTVGNSCSTWVPMAASGKARPRGKWNHGLIGTEELKCQSSSVGSCCHRMLYSFIYEFGTNELTRNPCLAGLRTSVAGTGTPQICESRARGSEQFEAFGRIVRDRTVHSRRILVYEYARRKAPYYVSERNKRIQS